MTAHDLGARFEAIRCDLGELTQKSMSLRLGLSENTWRSYEKGSGTPSWSTIEKLSALGYSPTWMLTGAGAMKLEGAAPPATARSFPVDADLMARATDAVAKLHREMGFKLADARLGALVFELLAEVGDASDGPEEYEAQLEIMLGRLRKRLKTAIAEPGTGKRLA